VHTPRAPLEPGKEVIGKMGFDPDMEDSLIDGMVEDAGRTIGLV
jgi:hypothetical protein